jgi:hypothetical protein
VKSSRLILLIIGTVVGTVVAQQACAESISNQPLTRIECDKAGLYWNENANVCGSASEEAKTTANFGGAERSSQPLTRSECDKAGLAWNDNANACGEKLGTQGSVDRKPSPLDHPHQHRQDQAADDSLSRWRGKL